MKDLYVKNENNLIYKITNRESISDDYDGYTLELVCGIDYVNEDSDFQAYVNNKRFVKDVQIDTITVNTYDECLKDRLEEEGYVKIDKLPKIY